VEGGRLKAGGEKVRRQGNVKVGAKAFRNRSRFTVIGSRLKKQKVKENYGGPHPKCFNRCIVH